MVAESASRKLAVWLAGTRSEILQLGCFFKFVLGDFESSFLDDTGLIDPPDVSEFRRSYRHEFVFTGEQGTAAYQALDLLEIRPHDEFGLRPAAEDPALRLIGLMEGIEQYARRHRADMLLSTGFGPTAAAAALIAHSRPCKSCWLEPLDPAKLNRRMSWERGLVEIIRSTGETGVMKAFPGVFDNPAARARMFPVDSARQIETSAPTVLISVGRCIWGSLGVLARVVKASARWARRSPKTQWIILHSLDARLAGPFNSMPDRPLNLRLVLSMPYPEYSLLLDSVRSVLTDSPHIARECFARGIPVVTLGELPAETAHLSGVEPDHLAITPNGLDVEETAQFLMRGIA